MPKVTYITPAGESIEINANDDVSVMKTAVNNRVPGIVGECGGELQCATCHVHIENANDVTLPPVSDDEDEMLEAAACKRTATSRLCCQIAMTSLTDGLVVRVPESQY